MPSFFTLCRVFLLGTFVVGGITGFAITQAQASTRTESGVCGSILPTNTQLVGKNRYRVSYVRSMYELLKFYRKVFGRDNTDYPVTRLLALPHVVAYHIQNKSGRGSWKGMNLVHYRRKSQMQIYVICSQ